jgi:hypothetical protein
MSRSQFRHPFMVFDTAIDSHLVLPLTLEEALDDLSQDGRLRFSSSLRPRQSEKSLYLPAAPPSTRKSSFEIFDHKSHDKARGESFSSNGTAPSMVEDHSGLSDSDADPVVEYDSYEESMGRLWDTYETLLVQDEPSDAILFHQAYLPEYPDSFKSPMPPYSSEARLPQKAPQIQSRFECRGSKENRVVKPSFIPVPARNKFRVRESSRCFIETSQYQGFNVPDPLHVTQATGLHHSHAQRTAGHGPNILKSLPATPKKRAGCSLQPSLSKRSRSHPLIRPFPQKQHSAYHDLPYHSRPVTNPRNSSHAYSAHTTPPLPMLEKSVFDYDTDDETRHDPVTQLSASIAAKMHIRGLSLGSKFGLGGKKEGGRYEGTGRRRSATEIVMGVFGFGKK